MRMRRCSAASWRSAPVRPAALGPSDRARWMRHGGRHADCGCAARCPACTPAVRGATWKYSVKSGRRQRGTMQRILRGSAVKQALSWRQAHRAWQRARRARPRPRRTSTRATSAAWWTPASAAAWWRCCAGRARRTPARSWPSARRCGRWPRQTTRGPPPRGAAPARNPTVRFYTPGKSCLEEQPRTACKCNGAHRLQCQLVALPELLCASCLRDHPLQASACLTGGAGVGPLRWRWSFHCLAS